MAEKVLIADLHAYTESWTDKMIEIWLEKIERRRIVDTGALHESFSSQVGYLSTGATIEMKFLEYGLAQEFGVGNGYTRGNGGDLQILDPDYRESHGLDRKRRAGARSHPNMTSGEPRSRRPWFNAKYHTSVGAMVEALARIGGEHAAASIADSLSSSIGSGDL